MIIPSKVKILGHELKVVTDKELINRHDYVGQADFRYNEIRLQPKTTSQPIPQTQIEETFLHEIIHWVLHLSAEKKEIHSEEFVDRFSNMLYAVLKNNDLLK